jgi:hypothetical protein
MVIRAVDQKDTRGRLSQRLRSRQAAEASANDYDSGCSLGHDKSSQCISVISRHLQVLCHHVGPCNFARWKLHSTSPPPRRSKRIHSRT